MVLYLSLKTIMPTMKHFLLTIIILPLILSAQTDSKKLYTNSNDEKEVANYRSLAEKDWDNHKTYSELTILFVKVIGVGWITNTIHAWIVGPRPKTKIHRKWDTPIVNP